MAARRRPTLRPMTQAHTKNGSAHPFGAPHRFVDVGPSRIATWKFGQGPDLVLVHGWPLHSGTFRHILPALEKHFTVHLVDLPGAGQTVWGPSQKLDLLSLAKALGETIDALGLTSYAFLAHDSGGLVARFVAAEHGERVFGIVLGNTEIPGHTPWLVSLLVAMGRIPGGGPTFLSLMRLGLVRRSFLGFGGCFTDPTYVDGEFGQLFVEPLLQPGRTRDGVLGVLAGFDAGALRALSASHPRIPAPVSLIWGEDDAFFPLADARRMLPTFPGGADLVVLRGAKLFPHEDHPAEFVEPAIAALKGWCSRATA